MCTVVPKRGSHTQSLTPDSHLRLFQDVLSLQSPGARQQQCRGKQPGLRRQESPSFDVWGQTIFGRSVDGMKESLAAAVG